MRLMYEAIAIDQFYGIFEEYAGGEFNYPGNYVPLSKFNAQSINCEYFYNPAGYRPSLE